MWEQRIAHESSTILYPALDGPSGAEIFLPHLVQQYQQSTKYCVETNLNTDVITFTDKLFGVDSTGQRRFERNVLYQKPAERGGAAQPTIPVTSLFVLVRWGTEFVYGVGI